MSKPNSKAAQFQHPSKYELKEKEVPALDEGNALRETLKGKKVLEDIRTIRPLEEWEMKELKNAFRLQEKDNDEV